MGDAGNATEHDPTAPAAMPDARPAHAAVGAPLVNSGDDVMDLLAEHVPLALLADLVAPGGPGSSEILAAEGLPDDAWWETPDAAGTSPRKDAPDPGFSG
jgi:hypothetical protein